MNSNILFIIIDSLREDNFSGRGTSMEKILEKVQKQSINLELEMMKILKK